MLSPNYYFLAAGVLCVLLGLAHSILGEILIFHPKRKKGRMVPTIGEEGLAGRYLGIIWATWHLATIFGWLIGAMLIEMAYWSVNENATFVFQMINGAALSMFVGALFVLVGTKGQHLGWIVLCGIGVLLLLGM